MHHKRPKGLRLQGSAKMLDDHRFASNAIKVIRRRYDQNVYGRLCTRQLARAGPGAAEKTDATFADAKLGQREFDGIR